MIYRGKGGGGGEGEKPSPASIRERQPPQTEAIEEDPLLSVIMLSTLTLYGNSSCKRDPEYSSQVFDPLEGKPKKCRTQYHASTTEHPGNQSLQVKTRLHNLQHRKVRSEFLYWKVLLDNNGQHRQ